MALSANKYLIVRDGKTEHLLKLSGEVSRSVAASSRRQDLLAALISDAGLILLELDVPSPVTAASVSTKSNAVKRSSRPKRRAPSHKKARPKSKGLGPVARMAAFRNNPKCPSCNKPLNVSGHHNGVTYYKCKQGCPPLPRGEGLSSLTINGGKDLAKIVRQRVAIANGHDPQLRDDIVQEILTDIAAKKLTLPEVDRETIRRYIRSQSRLGQHRHGDLSIDAPLGQSTMTLAEVIEG